MERLDLSSGAMTFRESAGGVEVKAQKIEIARPMPGSVAQHESAHIVAAGKIKSATIIPSGNALGTTTPEVMTAARSALSGKQEEMHEVATLLEERKTIYQSDVEEARENVRRRQNGIFPVEVEITSLKGKTISYTTESINSEVQIKDDVIEPLKAA